MSISRNSRHKRRATGGRMPIHKKKRKFEMGRVPTMTKLGAKKCINVRGRGNNVKRRALRADNGNFAWGSESMAAKKPNCRAEAETRTRSGFRTQAVLPGGDFYRHI